MFDLKDLYQEVIVDHNRSPRNFGKMEEPDRTLEGFNPLCGDRLTLYLKMDGDQINDISFDGSGCAISVASASMMTDTMKGKTTQEAENIFNNFHELVTTDGSDVDAEKLGKLAALAGVREYPTRVKCATLCWHTLHSALEGDETAVSTE
jgi:nitrogen fixation NifU-like protein